jgi:ATP synthase protein I
MAGWIPPDQMRAVGALMSVGLSFVLAIVLGTLAGWWIDKAFGTSPWALILFFFLGFAAGVLNVYRATKPHVK